MFDSIYKPKQACRLLDFVNGLVQVESKTPPQQSFGSVHEPVVHWSSDSSVAGSSGISQGTGTLVRLNSWLSLTEKLHIFFKKMQI